MTSRFFPFFGPPSRIGPGRPGEDREGLDELGTGLTRTETRGTGRDLKKRNVDKMDERDIRVKNVLRRGLE